MDKFLAHEVPEENRFSFLKDNADAIEEIGYTRRFTPEELSQKKEKLSETCIKINDLEVEKKEMMDGFKEELKPFNEEKQQLLIQIKSGSEHVDEECAKILFHEEKMAGYYNKLGELVYSRPIMPQEMQKTIFSINSKTGTNE